MEQWLHYIINLTLNRDKDPAPQVVVKVQLLSERNTDDDPFMLSLNPCFLFLIPSPDYSVHNPHFLGYPVPTGDRPLGGTTAKHLPRPPTGWETSKPGKTERQQDSKTARQQDSKTARQQDSKTARQQDSKTARQQDRQRGQDSCILPSLSSSPLSSSSSSHHQNASSSSSPLSSGAVYDQLYYISLHIERKPLL
jgi:hypothetical protein